MTPLRLSHLCWQEFQQLKDSLGMDLLMKGDTVSTFINVKDNMGQIFNELLAIMGKVTDLKNQISHRAWEKLGSAILAPLSSEENSKLAQAKDLIKLCEELIYSIRESGERATMVINATPTWLYDLAAGFRFKVGEWVQLGESGDWGWIKDRRTITLSNNRVIYALTVELVTRQATISVSQESVKDIMGVSGVLTDLRPGDYVAINDRPGQWGQLKSVRVDKDSTENAPYTAEVLLEGNELNDAFPIRVITKIKPLAKVEL